jgi:hypothetical protein
MKRGDEAGPRGLLCVIQPHRSARPDQRPPHPDLPILLPFIVGPKTVFHGKFTKKL